LIEGFALKPKQKKESVAKQRFLFLFGFLNKEKA
jgi:hypothetical protein